MEQNLTVIVLVGTPCSGKSTWIKKNMNKIIMKHQCQVDVISRDAIRLQYFSPDGTYVFNPLNEKNVTEIFNDKLKQSAEKSKAVIILDNTHVKRSYIEAYFRYFESLINQGKAKIYIKVFDEPYWKLCLRNIRRKISEKKWIPFKALKKMYNDFQSLNLIGYESYDG